uniref:Uncharacterized protein n=1 Tax=Anguilla anguilla TaxID=7936 RepID=A0A0E9VEW2_ANGAN
MNIIFEENAGTTGYNQVLFK